MNDFSKYSDESLVRFLREANPLCDQAFDTIYNRHASRLNAYCIFKSGSIADAEELFEDTWLKFLDRARDGKELDNILPYLYSIARTLAIDRHRKENGKKALAIEYKDMNELGKYIDPNNFLKEIENNEMIEIVKTAVNKLDEKHKEAFVLHWFGSLSHKEIASVIGISAAGVKMRCHRAMKSLIKMLRPQFIEDSK